MLWIPEAPHKTTYHRFYYITFIFELKKIVNEKIQVGGFLSSSFVSKGDL